MKNGTGADTTSVQLSGNLVAKASNEYNTLWVLAENNQIKEFIVWDFAIPVPFSDKRKTPGNYPYNHFRNYEQILIDTEGIIETRSVFSNNYEVSHKYRYYEETESTFHTSYEKDSAYSRRIKSILNVQRKLAKKTESELPVNMIRDGVLYRLVDMVVAGSAFGWDAEVVGPVDKPTQYLFSKDSERIRLDYTYNIDGDIDYIEYFYSNDNGTTFIKLGRETHVYETGYLRNSTWSVL